MATLTIETTLDVFIGQSMKGSYYIAYFDGKWRFVHFEKGVDLSNVKVEQSKKGRDKFTIKCFCGLSKNGILYVRKLC